MTLECEGAICSQRRFQAVGANVWETRFGERPELREQRHAKARALCSLCPVLEQCEEFLRTTEAKGILIDGIVAGRTSDVQFTGWGEKNFVVLRRCRACDVRLQPRRLGASGRALRPGQRPHRGEGLCDLCFPRFSRVARGKEVIRFGEFPFPGVS